MTEDQEKQFNLHGCVSRSIIKAAEVGESQKRITKENHKRESQKGKRITKGDILLYNGNEPGKSSGMP